MDEIAPAGPTPALKVIGLLLVFRGAEAVCGMVASLFFQSSSFDLSSILLPAGIGLLKLQRSSRLFLLFLYFLSFGLMGALVLPGVFHMLSGGTGLQFSIHRAFNLYGKHIGKIPAWVAMDATVVEAVLYLWIFLVLWRERVDRLFSDPPQTDTPLSRGLRIGVAVAVLLALAQTAGALYVRHNHPASDDELSWDQAGRVHQIAWGYRWGRLAYVAYRRTDLPPGTRSYTTRSIVASGPDGATLVMPDRSSIDLPGPHFMYDLVNGHWRVSDFRVTGPELEAFRKLHPTDFSIDALTAFARRMRSGRQ